MRVTLRRPGASGLVAYDTVIAFPPNADTLVLDANVPIRGASEQFDLYLRMIRNPADTVFASGPDPVTANAGVPTQVVPMLKYVGVGAKAKDVVFQVAPAQVFFGDTALFVAVARDSSGVPIPGTPIAYASSDTTRARVPADSIGRVVGRALRGPVTVSATLLTNQSVTAPLVVQPVPAALGVFSGNAQTGPVGSALAQPVTVRVKAADSLGVQGVVVSFVVSSGGGTLSQSSDTTDPNGDASAIWTLGNTLGPQSLTASAAGLTGATASVAATGVVGSPKRLAFQVQPTAVAANVAIAPPVQVVAQDTFGNTVGSFTGNVTIAIGANPGSATLGGTATVQASAGVATFGNLTLNVQGTGYTLVASSTGLTGATSSTFNVSGGVPTQLVFTQQPTGTTAGTAFTPPLLVEIRDVNGNVVVGATNPVTLTIANNPGAGTLSGTTTRQAVAGVATFDDVSINRTGTGYTLQAAVGGVGTVVSSAFDIGSGLASVLVFTTQPPASALFQAPFSFTVSARDALGNPAAFGGAVTVGIGTNPAGGTLSGTLTQTAVGGVATFTGVSIDNIGAGYTLSAGATGLTTGVSSAFNVVAPTNVNAWINPAGGNWGTAGNWSRGTVPAVTDTVMIRQSGTYTVNLDVNATVARLDVGAPSGTQTLQVNANTLTLAGNGALSTRGFLALGGGQVSGPGVLDIGGGLTWTAGSLAGGNGTVRVLAGGTFTFAPTASTTLSAYTLELAGNGTWSGAQQLNTGQGALLRVLGGATLDIQGDPTVVFNQGGTILNVNVLGTLVRSTSTGVAAIGVPVNDSGAVNVLSGTLNLAAGGASSGAFSVSSGAILQFGGGTSTLAATTNVAGAGIVLVSNGTASFGGGYTLTGATEVTGGTATFDAATSATTALGLAGGNLGGAGLLTVSGALSWTGGGFGGGGGTTRVLAGGTLSFVPTAGTSISAYTLEVAGNGIWTGAQQLNTGQGAVLRVLGGGVLDVQGDPNVVFNLGGALPTLHVQGTLRRSTSGNVAAFGIQLNDVGLLDVQTGTLRFTAGSAGSFGGSVTGAGLLDLAGGTFTLTSNLLTAGPLQVGGGALLFSNHFVSVGGDFATASGGTLTMNAATDSLNVAGNATFGGGTSALTGGVIRVLGNFAQAGAGNAFAPTGQRMRLEGPAPALQTVAFANPTTSFFDSLIVDRGFGARAGVQLLSDILVNRGMRVANSTDITGPTSRVTIAGGTLQAILSTTSPTMTSLRAIELSQAPLIGTAPVLVSPDTMIYNGAIANLPTSSGLSYRSVRVNTTGTLTSPGNVTYNGNLIVSSGAYSIGSGLDSVGGFLRTENAGAFAMVAIVASPTVAVRDSAVFAGGASTSLTGGLLRVRGNFVQRGAANAFAASGTHRVAFVRGTAGTQTIQFQDPVNSFFRDLLLNRPILDTVRMLSDVLSTDSVILSGLTVLASTTFEAIRTPATGALDVHSNAVLRPFKAEFGTFFADSAFTGAVRVFPDTAVFLNGGFVDGSPAYGWRSLRLVAGSMQSNGATFNGDLIIQGGLYNLALNTDSVTGFLRTEGTGVLGMTNAEGENMVVQDSAVFAGGSEAGQLTGGTLRIRGNFVQRGTGSEFQATPGHLTVFAGTTRQTVTFATPGTGAGQSTFGNLFLGRTDVTGAQPTAILLGSPIFVVGQIEDTSAIAVDTVLGGGNAVTTKGLSVNSTMFDNAPVVVDSSGTQPLTGNAVTFRNMAPTVTQLAISRPGGSYSINQVAFLTAPTTGLYFSIRNTTALGGPLTLSFANPIQPGQATPPAVGQYAKLGGPLPTVFWGSLTLP